jgi:PAT family beta-lactamase induction signal transducer AmpG
VREPKERPRGPRFSRSAFRSLLDWGFILIVALGLVYPMTLWTANGMTGAFLNEEFAVPLGRVGLYTSVFGLVTVLGGLAGGPAARRFGRQTSLLIALLLASGAVTGFALLPSPAVAWDVVALFGMAFGFYETVYMAMGMGFSDPRIAAFTFSLIMAVGNIGIGLGQPLPGVLVDAVGFAGCSQCWRA